MGLFDNLRDKEIIVFGFRRVLHDVGGLPAVRHDVGAHMQLRSANRGQRHNVIGRDRVQLLDPGENAVQLALQAVRLLRRNFHSGKVRDPLHRRLVDLGLCHGCL